MYGVREARWQQPRPPLGIGLRGDVLFRYGVDQADLLDALRERVRSRDEDAVAVDGDDGELALRLERLALIDSHLNHRCSRAEDSALAT